MLLRRYVPAAWCTVTIAVAVIAAIAVKLFCFEFIIVDGTSMEPSVGDGTIAFIHKSAYGIINPLSDSYIRQTAVPRPDDVVVYAYNGTYVIKRCVALSGAPVSVKKAEDDVFVLTIGLTEMTVTKEQVERFMHTDAVPYGMIFAAGDNRAESIDSRDYGFVPICSIRGKIILSAGKKIHE